MASFVESATLKVNDQSTAQINKINAALKQLFNTAKSLKSTTINLRVNAQGLTKAAADARALSAALRGLRSTNIRIGVNAQGITQAQRQIAQLRAQTQRPINVATTHAGGGARGGGGGGRPTITATGAARGFASGLGMPGASYLIGSYGAVAAAGYAAAAALRSVAENAAKRDRTQLQTATAASKAQQQIIEAGSGRPEGAGPITFTKDERTRLINSLLGDVQAPGATEEERAQGRAAAAVNIARELETKVLPRLYAAKPGQSREETMAGLRQLIQAVNLGSTDIVDAQGKFSQDGLRVLNGIQMAMAADPDLQPHTIKTALANLKTAGLSLSSDALARVLINTGNRGVKAANETFQAIRGASGTVDVKTLNNRLADMDLLQGAKRNKKGNVLAATGRPVDEELLNRDPSEWFNKHVRPKMEKALAPGVEERAKAAKTPEEAAEIRKQGPTNADIVAWVNKTFQGMTGPGKFAIAEMLTGFQQMNAAIEQARLALSQDVTKPLADSWTAAAESVKTAWTDAAADLGQRLAEKFNVAPILDGLAKQIREHPDLAVISGVGISVAALGFAANAAAGALGRLAGLSILPGLLPGAAAAGGGILGGILRAIPVIGAAAALIATVMPQPAGESDKEGVQALLKQQTDTLRQQSDVQKAIADLKALPPGTQAEQAQVKQYIAQLEAQVTALGARADSIKQALEKLTGDKAKPPDQAAADKAAADAEAARLKAAADEKSRVDAEVARIKAEQQDAATKAFLDAVNKMEAEKKAAADAAAKKKEEEAAKPKPTEPMVLPEVKVEPIKLDTTQLESLTFPGLTTTAETIKGAATTLESASSQYASLMTTASQNLKDAGPTLADPLSAAATAITTAAPQISSSFTQAAASMTAIGPQIAAPFTAAAGTLAATSATFAGVFQTGAAAIASSGQQAASALQAGAPAAGAALGAAAVAAIRAGVSGLTINVNANVVGGTASKGDPGASKGD